MKVATFLFIFLCQQAGANAPPAPSYLTGDSISRTIQAEDEFSPTKAFEPSSEPQRSRKFLLPPLLSFLIPGFDQYWEGQYLYGAAYTGVALGGYLVARNAANEYRRDSSHNSRNEKVRQYNLGSQLIQASGGFSAYHSFRTAVKTRQANGQFLFLKKEESPTDLLVAPFRFDYLLRPTTILPLGVGAALVGLMVQQERTKLKSLNSSDVFYSGAFSFNAGTHEEALFRGWIMPVSHHYLDNAVLANVTTSGLFAAAHLGTVSQPWPQALMGFYLGFVTQKRDWTLSESIFIHTWWDVMIFMASYATGDEATIRLPLVDMRF
ncbi:MAG: lysostaphin resistance A-like protein [Bdellovibrionales bacterium]